MTLATKAELAMVVQPESRCPRCDKLIARNLLGSGDLYCWRCRVEVRFDGMGHAEILHT